MKTYVKNTWIVADDDDDGRMEGKLIGPRSLGVMFHQVALIYVKNVSSDKTTWEYECRKICCYQTMRKNFDGNFRKA